jgi:hypothetical protein
MLRGCKVVAGKGGQDLADVLASALDGAYDNDFVLPDLAKWVSLASLCFHCPCRLIVSPMHAWIVHVDIVVLQCGGNLVDASSIGVLYFFSCMRNFDALR